jgi:uncharacterized SAM-binding protein YcdF (DUF218 family)
MILFLSKFLPIFIYPVGLACSCAVAGGIFLLFRKRKAAIVLVFLSAGLIWFFSCPLIAHPFLRSLEGKFNPPEEFPKASAIVLLGGCTRPPVSPRRHVEPSCASDRMVNAARLFRRGYAPVIIATGGKISFIYDFPGSEAGCMAGFLREVCGIDSSAILMEDQARDTHENATFTAALMEKRGMKKDIILVTSALHMYRSVKIFRKCGFTVFPAPADFREDSSPQWKILSLLPSVGALGDVTDALHEYYGLFAYKIMGRL